MVGGAGKLLILEMGCVGLTTRPVYKPHSVSPPKRARRSSLWDGCYHPPRAAYPELWLNTTGRRAASPPPFGGGRPCLALLPEGVAWLPTLLWTPVVSYTAFSSLPVESSSQPGGMSLWPDPIGCPNPGVTRLRALWSADFPRPFAGASGRDRPTGLSRIHNTAS